MGLFRFFIVVVLPTSLAFATESVNWGSGSVTYSDGVHMALESATQTINLSQFNASTAAAQNGGVANKYTLTKVVFSIDGSIAGVFEFENESPSSASNVKATLFDLDDPNGTSKAWSQVSYGAYSTAENYTASKTFATIGADSDGDPDWSGTDYGRFDVTSEGTGKATTADITEDLAAFTGSGKLPFQVDFQGVWTLNNLGNNVNRTDIYGDATVSVTYYYDYNPVPEPSTFVLLGLGCAAILARRRRKVVIGLSDAGTLEKASLEART